MGWTSARFRVAALAVGLAGAGVASACGAFTSEEDPGTPPADGGVEGAVIADGAPASEAPDGGFCASPLYTFVDDFSGSFSSTWRTDVTPGCSIAVDDGGVLVARTGGAPEDEASADPLRLPDPTLAFGSMHVAFDLLDLAPLPPGYTNAVIGCGVDFQQEGTGTSSTISLRLSTNDFELRDGVRLDGVLQDTPTSPTILVAPYPARVRLHLAMQVRDVTRADGGPGREVVTTVLYPGGPSKPMTTPLYRALTAIKVTCGIDSTNVVDGDAGAGPFVVKLDDVAVQLCP